MSRYDYVQGSLAGLVILGGKQQLLVMDAVVGQQFMAEAGMGEERMTGRVWDTQAFFTMKGSCTCSGG